MIQVTNSYNALRSLLSNEDIKGTIRINEFTETAIDSGVYRFIVDRVDWHCGGETITIEYKIEESKNGVWIEAFGRAPKKSTGKQNEFVNLITGAVVDISEAKTNGVLNEGFDSSYNHVMLTLNLRDQLMPLVDMFVKMNLDTKELIKYTNV